MRALFLSHRLAPTTAENTNGISKEVLPSYPCRGDEDLHHHHHPSISIKKGKSTTISDSTTTTTRDFHQCQKSYHHHPGLFNQYHLPIPTQEFHQCQGVFLPPPPPTREETSPPPPRTLPASLSAPSETLRQTQTRFRWQVAGKRAVKRFKSEAPQHK